MTANAPEADTPAERRAYLRPVGLLAGLTAASGCERGDALPLAGTGLAFTHAELWIRERQRFRHRLVAVGELPAVAAGEGEGPARQVGRLLDRLVSPAPRPAGLAGDRPLIMGVVNVTPDSFSDGGRHFAADRAIAHGLRLHAEGADVVDLGGESTRPGSEPVPVEEELRRVLPVVRALSEAGVVVSIDSRKAEVMRQAAAAGARIINDVSALGHDPGAQEAAAASGLPVVLMHCQGDPRTMQLAPSYDHAALDVFDELEARLAACEAAGLPRARLLADPGIGFGKTLEHNLVILRSLSLFRGLGVPLVLGVSRKSFIGRLGGEQRAEARLPGSLAAGLAALAQGVDMLRVHDVAATRQALLVWQAIAAVAEAQQS